MNFSPVPKYSFRGVTDITADLLNELGVKFLMLDLDNTIAPYGVDTPTENILKWSSDIMSGGISLYIVTNNRKKGRAEGFAKAMGTGYVKGAGKPFPSGVLRAMKEAGFRAGESALAGDQIYTDIIAANSAGAVSMLVMPISLKNPILALRYVFELPFRAAAKERRGNE